MIKYQKNLLTMSHIKLGMCKKVDTMKALCNCMVLVFFAIAANMGTLHEWWLSFIDSGFR